MTTYYAIIECTKCGSQIQVEFGYNCGFDAVFETIVDAVCLNKECLHQFEVNLDQVKHDVLEIDDHSNTITKIKFIDGKMDIQIM